jgi:hypothetical protein
MMIASVFTQTALCSWQNTLRRIADAIDWNEEKRRDTEMGVSDLKEWFLELAGLDNPVRREYHLFTLLCGSRPTALT